VERPLIFKALEMLQLFYVTQERQQKGYDFSIRYLTTSWQVPIRVMSSKPDTGVVDGEETVWKF